MGNRGVFQREEEKCKRIEGKHKRIEGRQTT